MCLHKQNLDNSSILRDHYLEYSRFLYIYICRLEERGYLVQPFKRRKGFIYITFNHASYATP